MSPRILSLSVLLAARMAVAEGTPAAPAPEIPEQCRTIAKQTASPSLQVAQAARVSLANCLADVRLAPLKLLDCEDSVLAVDDAMKESFELLDMAAASSDDVAKVVAEQAKAELYNRMVMRMLATLPPPGTTESSIAMHSARKSILDGLLARWRDGAAGAYQHILAIVKLSPALEKNPVVSLAVKTAKDRLRLHVAQRTTTPPSSEPAKPDDRDAIMLDTGEGLR